MSRFVYSLLLVLPVAAAHPLDVWHWRNPLPKGNPLNDVAYGNGLYVAVGEAGTILSSAEGKNWIRRESGTFDHLNSIIFANDQFIAVGNLGAIVTSPDGILWTARYGGTFFALNGVAFGNGIYVAVGEENTILTSVDGIIWVSRSSGRFYFSDVAYGNNTFVVAGSVLLTSADGLNWFRQALEPPLETIGFGNGIFVGGGSTPGEPGAIWTSVDGTNWRMRTNAEIRGVAYGAGKWAAVARFDGIIYSSSDSIHWAPVHTNSTPIQAVGFGAGRFIAVLEIGATLTSDDGVT